jgi:hypothetical protein
MFDLEVVNRIADFLRNTHSTDHVRVRQQHRYFFAAVPGRKISGALRRQVLDRAANRPQTLVAGSMAIDVVILFEAVDIDHDQRERTGLAHGPAKLVA